MRKERRLLFSPKNVVPLETLTNGVANRFLQRADKGFVIGTSF
ncbi:hypothetical protein [Bartonella sp. W8122]|nr:hypothetical protein [Bartonella sp. W8122]